MTKLEFNTLCQEIANKLEWQVQEDMNSDDVKYDSGHYQTLLKYNENVGLYIHFGLYGVPTTHIDISGFYPRDFNRQLQTPYNTRLPHCKIAISRGGDKIAKEIQSRFLPEYYKLNNEVIERNAKALLQHSRRMDVMSILSKRFNIPIAENGYSQDSQYTLYCSREKDGVSRIQVDYNCMVRFDVELPVDKAIAVLELLKEKEEEVI